jgi:hypothetical protein
VDYHVRFGTTSGLHRQLEEHRTRQLKSGLPFLIFHRHDTLADTMDHSVAVIRAQFFFSTPVFPNHHMASTLEIVFDF